MKAAIIILTIIIILLLAASLWLASFTLTGLKRMTLDEAMAWQSARYDTSFYELLEKTDYTVTGFDGYVLHAQLLKNPSPANRYVIITHGYTDNRIGALKYVPLYLEAGFNCVIYDLRGHGLNERTFTTYGILEAQDLLCLIKDTLARYPDLKELGLHGESLGAATTVTVLKYLRPAECGSDAIAVGAVGAADGIGAAANDSPSDRPPVSFAVADCAFSDIENVLRGTFRKAHLPPFAFSLADFGSRLRYHYSLKEMRPIDSLDGNAIPILFIHGKDDTLIPPKNSEDMFDRTRGRKDLFLVAGADHAVSVLVDPDGYRKALQAFLSR